MTRNTDTSSYTVVNPAVQAAVHDYLNEMRQKCYRVVVHDDHFFITHMQHMLDDCYTLAITILDPDGVVMELQDLSDSCIKKFCELRALCSQFSDGIPVPQDPDHLQLYMDMQYGTETGDETDC